MNVKFLFFGLTAVLGLPTSSCDASSDGVSSNASTEAGPTLLGDGSAGRGASGSSGLDAQTPTAVASPFTVQHQLASDVDPRAPTTVGIVAWSFDGEVQSARIEFGLDTSYGMTAPVDLAETGFRTLLLGMKPERTYHFRVVVDTASGVVSSDDYAIETGPATDRVVLADFHVVNEDARERGFIVTSYWQGPGATIPFIIDADGEIVWWVESSSMSVARARMSADAKNLWMVVARNSGGAVERVSMDGLDAEVYPETTASHDITPVRGSLMAYLDYGESDCNSIFEIDPSGETMEAFDSEDVLPGGRLADDGCHANALRYSRARDVYTLSDLYNDVFVVDRRGALVWRLSEIVEGGREAWGGEQHGHHLLEDGVVLFANRAGSSTTSAAVEYTLDGEEVLRYETGRFSANFGDVQRLPGGNTLVTFSNDSIIHEVDAEGNLLLEIDGGGYAFGYASWRSTLYASPDVGE